MKTHRSEHHIYLACDHLLAASFSQIYIHADEIFNEECREQQEVLIFATIEPHAGSSISVADLQCFKEDMNSRSRLKKNTWWCQVSMLSK